MPAGHPSGRRQASAGWPLWCSLDASLAAFTADIQAAVPSYLGIQLGIKIRRIGLPLLRRYPRMNAEEGGSRIRKMGRRLPVPVP